MDEDNDTDIIANLKSLASGEVKKLKVNDANVLLVRTKVSKTLYSAKKAIKLFVKTLPV